MADPEQALFPGFILRRYDGAHDCPIDDIRALRRVCWPELCNSGHSLDDEFDELALHWTLFDSYLVAAARLTIHTDLKVIPEQHLFAEIRSENLPRPIAYISRLVVHPCARGQGIAGKLDNLRISVAREMGCKSMICNWTPMSGLHRKRQLLQLGFSSIDNETPHEDGGFGASFIYWKAL